MTTASTSAGSAAQIGTAFATGSTAGALMELVNGDVKSVFGELVQKVAAQFAKIFAPKLGQFSMREDLKMSADHWAVFEAIKDEHL